MTEINSAQQKYLIFSTRYIESKLEGYILNAIIVYFILRSKKKTEKVISKCSILLFLSHELITQFCVKYMPLHSNNESRGGYIVTDIFSGSFINGYERWCGAYCIVRYHILCSMQKHAHFVKYSNYGILSTACILHTEYSWSNKSIIVCDICRDSFILTWFE